jgi:NADPH:quinone reductase
MYAVQLSSFGPSSNLVLTELPDPVPGPGQALISSVASGVHLIDISTREGEQWGAGGLPDLPAVLGREVAGTVVAVGEGADPSWTGRSVAAYLGPVGGGYATLAVADLENVFPVPEGLDAAEAVAMVATGRTAVAILEAAAITADDTVLVLAATGGLGALLVQEAKALGATVIAAAGGPRKVGLAESLGPDLAVDYDATGWAKTVPKPPTVVLEGVGGELADAAVDLLHRGGRVVSYGWASGSGHSRGGELEERGVLAPQVLGPAMANRPGGLRALQEQAMANLASGRWTPLVTRFPLSRAAAAHDALTGRATTGKVVLVPDA